MGRIYVPRSNPAGNEIVAQASEITFVQTRSLEIKRSSSIKLDRFELFCGGFRNIIFSYLVATLYVLIKLLHCYRVASENNIGQCV